MCIPPRPRTAHGAAPHITGPMQQPAWPSFRVTSGDTTTVHVSRTANFIYVTHRTATNNMGSRNNPYTNHVLPNLVAPSNLKPREISPERIPVLVNLLKKDIRSHYGERWNINDMTPVMEALFQTGRVVQYTIWENQQPPISPPRQGQPCAAQPAVQHQPGTATGDLTPRRRPGAAVLYSAGKVPPHPPGIKHCPLLTPEEITLTRHILLTQEN